MEEQTYDNLGTVFTRNNSLRTHVILKWFIQWTSMWVKSHVCLHNPRTSQLTLEIFYCSLTLFFWVQVSQRQGLLMWPISLARLNGDALSLASEAGITDKPPCPPCIQVAPGDPNSGLLNCTSSALILGPFHSIVEGKLIKILKMSKVGCVMNSHWISLIYK